MEESSAAAKNRRKRGLGMVTPNACVECRKKRAKCDGHNPCARCAAQNVTCVYEIPVRQSKEMMRTEIEELQQHRKYSERVLRAVSENHKEELEFIIEKLKTGMPVAEISEKLDSADLHKRSQWQDTTTYPEASERHGAITSVLTAAQSLGALPAIAMVPPNVPVSDAAWTAWQQGAPYNLGDEHAHDGDMVWMHESVEPHDVDRPPLEIRSPLVGTWQATEQSTSDVVLQARGRGQSLILGNPVMEASDEHALAPHQSWTSVTTNTAFVDHLLTLYFCWEYPIFASLSKEHFIEDYRAGRPRFCSALLVNAILALGCRYSSQPEAFEDPSNLATAGDHFFAEAQRLLNEQNDVSLTWIQALGLMAIREASCGRDANSIFYSGQSIKLAVELGLHRNHEVNEDGEPEWDARGVVESATFWGAMALDQAWSLIVGRVPHVTTFIRRIAKPPIITGVEGGEWVPYTDDGMPLARHCNQPSNVRSVFQCFCELSEIIQQSLFLLYAPGRRLNNQQLLTVYAWHLSWYDNLPVVLRLGHNFTPSVLFVHMYYHTAILLLFRPFIKLRMIGSGISPQEICAQCADTIAGLIHSFKQLYTLRRTPCFVPVLALTGSITHLLLAKETGNIQPVLTAAGVLKDLSECHGFARRALYILKYMAQKWDVSIDLDAVFDVSVADFWGGNDHDEFASLLRASSNLFCPGIDLLADSYQHVSRDGNDPLFSPFPLQGLPQLARPQDLSQDGFSMDRKGKGPA